MNSAPPSLPPSRLVGEGAEVEVEGDSMGDDHQDDGRAPRSIGVLIVAGVRLYREGLAEALDRVANLHVVATAAHPHHVDAALIRGNQAVVLLDVVGTAGVTDASFLLSVAPQLRLIALGVTGSESEIIAYAECGVTGYLPRDGSIAELVSTVESVANDEMPCSPRIAAALIRRVAALAGYRESGMPETCLSQRELEIVSLLERGLSNKGIARELGITMATAKNHVHHILEKLRVRGRGEVVAWARRRRLHGSGRVGSGHQREPSDGSH